MGLVKSLGIVVVALAATAAPVRAQTLADLARQEAARRQAIRNPARVYTNRDLRTGTTAEVPTAAPQATAASQAETGRRLVTPALFRSGEMPPIFPTVPAPAIVTGGQAFVELTIGTDGRVMAVKPLRTSVPLTTMLVDAVRDWQFAPALETVERPGAASPPPPKPVESKVLVAAVYRSPYDGIYQGPSIAGEPPRDVAAESEGVPFPESVLVPPYPPMAFQGLVVAVEVRVSPIGVVADAKIVRPGPPFDDAALTTARQWTFRPARVNGQPVESVAYIVFGFTTPTNISQ